MKDFHTKFRKKISLFRCLFPLIVFLFFVLPLSAQNYTLTSNGDSHASTPTSSPNDGGGQITLRSALEAATQILGTHIITIPPSITVINLTLGSITVGNSSVGNNITINGPGKGILTINQTTAAQIFVTGLGAITFVLTDLTLNYNGPATNYGGGGGAILTGGVGATTTLTNVAITNFTKESGSGGALLCTTASATNNLTLTNCDFTGNISSTTGGAVEYNGNGTCSISNCKFTGNQVANTGGDGGAITTTGSGSGGTITITNCTFVNNKVLNTTASGGAIANGNGALSANYNRFVGNTAATAANGNTIAELITSTINADNNWWGINTGPTANDKAAGSGTITVTKWLQLKTSALPASICGGGSTSIFTASFLSNSAGQAVSTANLVPEIGLPITFVNPVLGALSFAQTVIQGSGTATVTYTSGSTGGTGSVNAVVDNIPNNDVAPAKGTITVNQPVVSNPGVTTGTNGTAFSQTFTQSGAVGGATFTLNSGTLPTGLTLSTAGVLSGTPTQSGNFPLTVKVTDGNGCTGTGPTYNLVINPGVCPTITVTNPGTTTGTNGTPFSQTFTQSGAVGGATFTLNSGTLPTGLTLSTGGVLSGTPVQSGNFPITVQVTDGNGCVGDGGTYNLVISGGAGASSPSDYFRTITTGNWADPTTWESSPASDFSSGVVSPATLAPDFNASAINIRSTHSVTVTADVTTDKTFVNPGGTLTVAGSTTLIVNNNGLTVQSGPSGTGSIGNSAGTINGYASVERYISSSNNRAYRLLGPSVNTTTSIHSNWQEGATSNTNNPKPGYGTQITGTTADQTNGFDATITGQGSLFTYDPTTPAWVPSTNTDVSVLDAKTGYLLYIRGDRSIDLTSTSSPLPSTNTTLRATGTLLQGTQNFSGLASNDFSLVTNPYASAINWASIYSNNSASFNNYYTYWDPNIGSRGGYVTVTNGGIVSPAASGTVNIQSGQAFFVNSITASPTLTIQETDKSTTNNIDVFRTASASEKFTVSLYYNDPEHGRRLADGVTELYDNSYSAAVDNNDAEEINNFDENIAIARAGKHLSIEERPIIGLTDTLPLFMNNMKQQGYEFEFNPTSFNHPGMIAQLVDKFTGSRTPVSITTTTVVPFTITSDPASIATDRFSVLFINPVALPVTLSSVKAYQKNEGVQVEWTTQQEFNLDHYEVERSQDGQQFTRIGSVQATGNSSSVLNYSLFDANPFGGVNFYRIKSVDRIGQATYSAVVKVNISGNSVNMIKIYPNPINNNSITLQLNLQKGTYVIQLTNKLGQQILSKVIDHPGGSAIQIIDLAKTMAAGIYQLNVTGGGVSITQQVIKN